MAKTKFVGHLRPMDNAPVLLFAEDDADIAFLICREFRRLLPAWEICHVPDGREATRRLERGLKPRLLVTDLNMPGMDGFALIEWVRRNEERHLSVFVLSNSAEPDARPHCRELGADEFFTKNMGSVRETVAAVVACFLEKERDAGAGLELVRGSAMKQDAFPPAGDTL
jgi:CheY-like chemotaxis protein